MELVDVRWVVAIWITVLSLMSQQVSCITSCDDVIRGNSTFNAKGKATSPNFPELQRTTYSCAVQFESDAADQYLELTFTDFILDHSHQGGCFAYVVKIHTSQTRTETGCERPKRRVFRLDGRAVVEIKSRSSNLLQAFRFNYRFLPAEEGERLNRQQTYEPIRYNYDLRDNYQGSIKANVDLDSSGREQWVDVIHYIRAPPGHQIVLDAAFMQEHRTTSLEIHDGATSDADQIAQSDTTSLSLYKSTQDWVYIRWFGVPNGAVTLNIDFTFFRETGSSGVCPSGYFKCTNDLCIPSKLLCNGVDNCYDGPNSNDEDPQGECQGTINACNGNICLNDGMCVNDVCVCAEFYSGQFCENFDNQGPDYTDLQHTSIMIGAFVGAVCLLSICWLIAMARKRQTDAEPAGRLHRIISVHSPEESGVRRQSTINAQSNIELPPNYSEAVLCREGSFSNKNAFPRSSVTSMNRRISANDPTTPPPAYDIVANDLEDDGGIVFRIPETVHEGEAGEENDNEESTAMNVLNTEQGNALPDVVTSQESSPSSGDSNQALTRHDTPV